MSQYRLSKTRFRDGVWEGVIACDTVKPLPPQLAVTLLDRPVQNFIVAETGEPGRWRVEVPVPPEAIGDGVHSILIRDTADDVVLGSITLIAGAPLDDDIRAEVALLRAEIDMMKRVCRRLGKDRT